MSRFRIYAVPRSRLALFAATLLLVALAGWLLMSRAASAAPTAPASGQPVAGPPATLSVVNLRDLPPAPNVPHLQPLFHRVGGPPPPESQWQRAIASLTGLNLFSKSASGPLGFGAPTVITSAQGITSEESGGTGGPCGCVPPDGDMSAGPNHVIVDVNQAFSIYNKNGVRLAGPVGFDTFFNGCGPAGLTSSDGITAYDPVADRFTVGILRYNGNTQDSYVSLAVSRSGDPTGLWNRYCFEQTYLGIGFLYDFPHISVGQSALYTTGNLYPPNGEQNVSARVNAYNKQQMYSGALTATQVLSDVVMNSDGTTADTIRPVLFNHGLPTATNYFVNVSSTPPSSRVTLWRWTDPFGANQFVQAGGVDVATFAPPVSMLQPPPGQPMPPPGYIDARTLAGAWYNGTVYSAHTIGCNPGAGVTDCIQWYQIGSIDAMTPTLVQQGIYSGTNESRAYPNLTVDTSGNVELAYAFSSLTDFIGIRHTGRLASDPLGEMGPEGMIKAGEVAETGFNAARYGDFSGSVTDPDGVTLWHFEEYTQNIPDPLGSWGTWTSASRFLGGGTPTPTVTGVPPTSTSTATLGPTNTPLPSFTPRPSNTPLPTITPGGPTLTPTRTPTLILTILPTLTATPTLTMTPGGPTLTPRPSNTPGGPTNTPAATPTDCPNPFIDINGNIFYTAIHRLYCQGVVNGTTRVTYSPAATATRGQFAKIVVLGLHVPLTTPTSGQTFSDVPPTYFAYLYIESGYAAGVLNGFDPAGCAAHNATYPCYLPNIPITRGQLTKLVVNAAHYPLYTPTSGQTFTDVPPSNVFFVSIETAAHKGVVNGYPDHTFRPNNNIRRDEMAQIVYAAQNTP